MAASDFLPFATDPGADVQSQADYAAASSTGTGFIVGVAEPAEVNKVWRQAAFMAAMLGKFIVDRGALNALDDGDLTAIEANFYAAVRSVITLSGIKMGAVTVKAISAVLTTANLGQLIKVSVTGTTQTLPAIAGCPAGTIIAFEAKFATGTAILAGSGVEQILTTLGGTGNTFTMNAGESLMLVSNGAAWEIFAYTSVVTVTQAPGDNSTKLASTAYADAIAALKVSKAGDSMTGDLTMATTGALNYGSTTQRIAGLAANAGLSFVTGAAEQARFDSSGNLMSNCNTMLGGGARFYAKGSANFYAEGTVATGVLYNCNYTPGAGAINWMLYTYNGGTVGSITSSGATTAFNTTSDYRLKTHVKAMKGALDSVMKMKPVTYQWKRDGSDGEGFIAHELQEILPAAVTGEKDAMEDIGDVTEIIGNLIQDVGTVTTADTFGNLLNEAGEIVWECVVKPENIGETFTWKETGRRIVAENVPQSEQSLVDFIWNKTGDRVAETGIPHPVNLPIGCSWVETGVRTIGTGLAKPLELREGISWTKTGTRPIYQGIDTSFLVARLVSAIQELNKTVAEQSARLAKLEKK